MRKKVRSKRHLALFVVVAVIITTIAAGSIMKVSAGSSDTVLSKAPDLYKQVRKGYNMGTKGPIMMVKGKLKQSNNTKDIYLVMLSGTEMVSGQATSWNIDMLSSAGKDNAYLTNVVNTISNNAPKNSNLVVAGHSLGGMIAQQVSTNKTVKDNYNILNVIGFGSPLINPTSREGTVVRLGDTKDIVPSLTSVGSLYPKQNAELCKENGGYSNALTAHSGSYARNDVWGKYDVLGKKGGNASISFNMNDFKFYKNPTKVNSNSSTQGTSNNSSSSGLSKLFNLFTKTRNSSNDTNDIDTNNCGTCIFDKNFKNFDPDSK